MCEAREQIEEINKKCALRGTELALMQKDISNIKKTTDKIEPLERGVNELLAHFGEDGVIKAMDNKIAYANGKTAKHSESIKNFNKWKSEVTGGMKMMKFLLLPIALWAFFQIGDYTISKFKTNTPSISVEQFHELQCDVYEDMEGCQQ